jgi:hypothetical protein
MPTMYYLKHPPLVWPSRYTSGLFSFTANLRRHYAASEKPHEAAPLPEGESTAQRVGGLCNKTACAPPR